MFSKIPKFTGKHLSWSLLFNEVPGWKLVTLFKKRLQHRCFIKIDSCKSTKNSGTLMQFSYYWYSIGKIFLFQPWCKQGSLVQAISAYVFVLNILALINKATRVTKNYFLLMIIILQCFFVNWNFRTGALNCGIYNHFPLTAFFFLSECLSAADSGRCEPIY